jgi:hypothetical protein
LQDTWQRSEAPPGINLLQRGAAFAGEVEEGLLRALPCLAFMVIDRLG